MKKYELLRDKSDQRCVGPVHWNLRSIAKKNLPKELNRKICYGLEDSIL